MLPKKLPEPTLFAQDQGEPALRWGMVGAGWIATHFISALHRHTLQRIVAVTTRTSARSEQFATAHGIEHCLNLNVMLDDPRIDVVYIAAPQSEHVDLGLACIQAGKHVLIEKPLATSASGAATLIRAARNAGVFLMEAMWTRYLPQTLVIRQLLADGVLGEVRSVAADHGQEVDPTSGHRLLQPGTGGGALLDLGIYPIQFDSMILGTPDAVTCVGALTETGVDAFATVVLSHGRHQSIAQTSIVVRTPTVAAVSGTLARIEVDGPFHIPTGFTVRSPDLFEPPLRYTDPTGVTLMDGLSWQATALASFVGEARVESPAHTHDETISILATIDEARRQLNAG